MKKKIVSLIILFAMVISLTGCVKYNATMEIKNDKSMDFTIIYGISNSMMELGEDQADSDSEDGISFNNEVLSQEEIQELKDSGYEVVDYSDDKFQGYKLTKKISNIDDYSYEGDVLYDLSKVTEESKDTKIFKVEKGTDKNTYTANFKFDMNEAAEESSNDLADTDEDSDTLTTDADSVDLSELSGVMASSMDLKFSVKLPNPAISNNATSVSDDKTELTWDLSTDKLDNISFKFDINNAVVTPTNNKGNDTIFGLDKNVVMYVGIAFVAVVLIMIILFARSNKKNKAKNDEAAPAPVPEVSATSITQASVTPEPVAPAPVTPEPVAPAPVTPEPVAPAPATPEPVAPAPATPEPVAPAPVTPEPVAPAPATTVVEIPAEKVVTEDEILITPNDTTNNTNQN